MGCTTPNLCIMSRGGVARARTKGEAQRGVTMVSGGANGTRYAGVVPDGVARVRVTPLGGAPAEVAGSCAAARARGGGR
jgi:hypothetical protein